MQLTIKVETLRLRIANRIRLSAELQDVLTTTVAELRSFLGSDRVKIYKFHPDQSGQVIAESVDSDRLPSLLGLNFPADDIPPEARELFVKSRVRSIVNLDTQQIGRIPLDDLEDEQIFSEENYYRPVDPCHVEYLTAMGVKSSLVVPVMHHDQLWGLLVSHHSESRSIPESELEVVQMVSDQLSLAIAQSALIAQANEKATREATIKRIAILLHSLPTIEYQSALAETITALGGSGGRICIKNQAFIESFADCLQASSEHIKVYAYGKQPAIPDQAKYKYMEQYSVWQERYKSGRYDIWAISDIYKVPGLRNLQVAFRPTKIRSILMIPLHYRQKLLGYLSIFRDEFETKTLWAGEFDPDGRQLYPRLSFEIWQESKTAQAREWNVGEIELARELSQQFAFAIHESELSQHHAHMLSTIAKNQAQQDTIKLEQSVKQQQALSEVIAKIRDSLNIESIFKTTTTEVCQLLQTDRVSVYRFNSDWGGEFVGDFEAANLEWSHISKLGINTVWDDTYLQETQGGRYRDNQTFVVDDIYQMGFSLCHIELLEQFHIKAFAIAPIFVRQKLWGLLAAYQHSGPRHWNLSDIQFLTQIAAQLGVALQQAELLAQTRQQAVDLQKAAEQQQLLFDVVAKIRASLELETIFQTTTKEVCQLLQTDRVSVYRFNSDWGGEFVGNFEMTNPEWSHLSKLGINTMWDDTYLQETQGGRYRHNETFAVDDIYQIGFTPCHIELLEQFHIQAFAIAPIFVGQKLWGLLAAYQHSGPRHWNSSDIKFLSQIAAQMGVALQQAELLAQTQQQAADLLKVLDELHATGQQKQFLLKVVDKMRKALTFSGHDREPHVEESLPYSED